MFSTRLFPQRYFPLKTVFPLGFIQLTEVSPPKFSHSFSQKQSLGRCGNRGFGWGIMHGNKYWSIKKVSRSDFSPPDFSLSEFSHQKKTSFGFSLFPPRWNFPLRMFPNISEFFPKIKTLFTPGRFSISALVFELLGRMCNDEFVWGRMCNGARIQ